MRSVSRTLLLDPLVASISYSVASQSQFARQSQPGAVFVMNNSGTRNEVISFTALRMARFNKLEHLQLAAAEQEALPGNANCWNAVTPNGRWVYVSYTASSTISGFHIRADGSLTHRCNCFRN